MRVLKGRVRAFRRRHLLAIRFAPRYYDCANPEPVTYVLNVAYRPIADIIVAERKLMADDFARFINARS